LSKELLQRYSNLDYPKKYPRQPDSRILHSKDLAVHYKLRQGSVQISAPVVPFGGLITAAPHLAQAEAIVMAYARKWEPPAIWNVDSGGIIPESERE